MLATSTPADEMIQFIAKSLANHFDRLDERLGAEDDRHKPVEMLQIGAHHAFPQAPRDASLADLIGLVGEAVENPRTYFSAARTHPADYTYQNNILAFPSPVRTDVALNNEAYAIVRPRPARRPAVIVLRHWNAPDRSYAALIRLLAWLGYLPVLVTLPFHGRRNRAGAVIADHFLSADLGRTIASVKQAVVEVRSVVDWLEARGHRRFGLIGVSLGSCVASLVSVADPRIRACALLLSAGGFAEVVWTGRATRHIRQAFDGRLSLADLGSVWRIISPASFLPHLARPDLRLLLLSAARDRVVLPELTTQFADQLRRAGADLDCCRLPCGHYTLAVPPFGILAIAKVASFLRLALPSTNSR